MDDLVQQALRRWPNVPAIAGWLKLGARGDWLLTGDVPAGLRITHQNMRRFIDRNYAGGADGRWFFQNGPQKVYVELEYTPWIYSLQPVESGHCLLSHTRVATVPSAVYLDENGQFLLQTPLGIGLLIDTDMQAFSHLLAETAQGWSVSAHWQLPSDAFAQHHDWAIDLTASALSTDSAVTLPAQPIERVTAAPRFGFVPCPTI